MKKVALFNTVNQGGQGIEDNINDFLKDKGNDTQIIGSGDYLVVVYQEDGSKCEDGDHPNENEHGPEILPWEQVKPGMIVLEKDRYSKLGTVVSTGELGEYYELGMVDWLPSFILKTRIRNAEAQRNGFEDWDEMMSQKAVYVEIGDEKAVYLYDYDLSSAVCLIP